MTDDKARRQAELDRYRQELLRPMVRLQRWAYAMLVVGVLAILVIAATFIFRG
jgi:hypothetical protein